MIPCWLPILLSTKKKPSRLQKKSYHDLKNATIVHKQSIKASIHISNDNDAYYFFSNREPLISIKWINGNTAFEKITDSIQKKLKTEKPTKLLKEANDLAIATGANQPP
jgi:hypothetical protein